VINAHPHRIRTALVAESEAVRRLAAVDSPRQLRDQLLGGVVPMLRVRAAKTRV
jgi:hypothetical protein